MVFAGRDNDALVITSPLCSITADMTNSRCSELYTLVTAPNRASLSRVLSIFFFCPFLSYSARWNSLSRFSLEIPPKTESFFSKRVSLWLRAKTFPAKITTNIFPYHLSAFLSFFPHSLGARAFSSCFFYVFFFLFFSLALLSGVCLLSLFPLCFNVPICFFTIKS